MRTRRGFIAIALVMVLGVLFGTGSPAGAADVPVSGSFTGTGSFESTAACPAFHTWHDGGGTWTGLGASTFNLDYCVTLQPGEQSPLVGTFTITAEDGTLAGDVTGFIGGISEPEGYPAHYELTITGGTGAFDQASGDLVFEAFWDGELAPVFSLHGTVTGTVVVPPAVPTTRNDCLHGGWRDLADDTGQPFRNQGACVAWVTHHQS